MENGLDTKISSLAGKKCYPRKPEIMSIIKDVLDKYVGTTTML